MRSTLFVMVCVLVMVDASRIVSNTVVLQPHYYTYRAFSGINRLTVDVYDTLGYGVNVYLNPGDLVSFDADTSLIHCDNVKECNVKDLPLDTGTYTLFIYNNYLFTTQQISYTAEYSSVEEEFYYIVGIVIVILSFSFVCCCFYCMFCHNFVKKEFCAPVIMVQKYHVVTVEPSSRKEENEGIEMETLSPSSLGAVEKMAAREIV